MMIIYTMHKSKQYIFYHLSKNISVILKFNVLKNFKTCKMCG